MQVMRYELAQLQFGRRSQIYITTSLHSSFVIRFLDFSSFTYERLITSSTDWVVARVISLTASGGFIHLYIHTHEIGA